MSTSCKMRSVILASLLVALLLLAGCGGGDNNEDVPTRTPTPEPVVITIGNLTDLTGVSANAMSYLNMALEDLAKYYNDHRIITGVELKVIKYDGQYDPSRDISGYEWLKEKGADLLFTPVASTAVTLKPLLEEDEMVLFTVAPNEEVLVPPGYVFAPGETNTKYLSYTLLKWIAENDPNFPLDRPARIGGASWAEPFAESTLAGAEEYAKAHPDQYQWEGGHLTNFTFTWGPEVAALKDCDYLIPPAIMTSFAKEYRGTGGSAKFIGNHAYMAFFGMIDDARLWDEIDGMLFIRVSRWWNEEDEEIDLAQKVLHEYHPDEAEDIIRAGTGYLGGIVKAYMMFEIIADAVEAVGPENFNSQALYNAAESFSLITDGLEKESFSETRRASTNYLAIYELRAAEKNCFRADPEWLPIVNEP